MVCTLTFADRVFSGDSLRRSLCIRKRGVCAQYQQGNKGGGEGDRTCATYGVRGAAAGPQTVEALTSTDLGFLANLE